MSVRSERIPDLDQGSNPVVVAIHGHEEKDQYEYEAELSGQLKTLPITYH